MSDVNTETFEPVKLYSNDFVAEQAKQEALQGAEDRLPKMRNRIARAQRGKLILIAAVASQIGDRTVADEAKEAAGVPKGVKLADCFSVTQSRRPSVSKEMVELGLVTQEERDKVLAKTGTSGQGAVGEADETTDEG